MQLLLNIDVADIGLAETFYTQAFDLHVGRRLGADVLELLGGGVPIYLLCKPAGSVGAAEQTRDYRRHWMPLHADWVVDDLDAALEKALAAGAVQEGDVRQADWGRIVQIADPFGHGWCLLQFRGRGYDELLDSP